MSKRQFPNSEPPCAQTEATGAKMKCARGVILVAPNEAMQTIEWALWAHDLDPGAPRAVITDEGAKIAAPDERRERIIQILARGIARGDLPCRVLNEEKWVDLSPPSEEIATELLMSSKLRIYRDPLWAFSEKMTSADEENVSSSDNNKSPSTKSTIRTTADQKNEIACGKWISNLAEDGNLPTKREVWEMALKEWPKLSRRAFDRAWAQNTPVRARSAGRPRKT